MTKLGLDQSELLKIDEEFEAITEGEELTRRAAEHDRRFSPWRVDHTRRRTPKRME